MESICLIFVLSKQFSDLRIDFQEIKDIGVDLRVCSNILWIHLDYWSIHGKHVSSKTHLSDPLLVFSNLHLLCDNMIIFWFYWARKERNFHSVDWNLIKPKIFKQNLQNIHSCSFLIRKKCIHLQNTLVLADTVLEHKKLSTNKKCHKREHWFPVAVENVRVLESEYSNTWRVQAVSLRMPIQEVSKLLLTFWGIVFI